MAPSVAPPPVWQSDVLSNITNQQTHRVTGGMGALSKSTFDPVQLSEAFRHAKLMDTRRDADLYDLLANTRREETYQPYFQGWPSLLQPVSNTIHEMPSMVQAKYKACQTMCFCGLFPEINHAWASIDNFLYLWRYERSGDVPVEYCGEEQAICAVGLVKPRPGVFLEAIQYLCVLATTTEVVLLGVCPTRGAGTAPSVALQPLPMYCVPSDNVVVSSVAGTAAGRIFMGGSDGHLYELQYAAADSWARKRCTKVRVTGRLQQLLPSFIPALLGGGQQGALDKVVVDDARHTLYTLSAAGHIQVFDLGKSGTDPARKVADITDFYQAAAMATGGRDIFRNAAGEKKSAAIKHIAPIPPSESSKLHLLAVTADGRRVYFTTHHLRAAYYGSYGTLPQSAVQGQQSADPAATRPTTLMAVFARPALPHADSRPAAGVEVVCAHYSAGTLLLSQAAPGSAGRLSQQLVLATRNSTLPLSQAPLMQMGMAGAGANAGAGGLLGPGGYANSAANTQLQGLRELLSQLDAAIPGETCAMTCVALPNPLAALPTSPAAAGGGGLPGPQDELVAQLFSAPPRFVVISTAGVMELEKRRPLEVLASMLETRNSARTAQFFEAYGAQEAAAMCVVLAASAPGTWPAAVVEEASACLGNPVLVGEPRMPQDVVPGTGMAQQSQAQQAMLGAQPPAPAGGGGIYMGQAVNPHPEPDWSPGHRGICLAVVRLLSPLWETKLTTCSSSSSSSSKNDTGLVTLRLPTDSLGALVTQLRAIEQFLGAYLSRRQQRGTLARYQTLSPAGAAAQQQQQGAGAIGGGFGYMGGVAGGLFGGQQQQMQEEDGAVAQAAKRQRVAAACQLEDDHTRRLRALVSKSAQALALVQLLAAHNLGRLTAGLPQAQRKQLLDLTLRDLVCEGSGEGLATQLISRLVSQQLSDATGAAAPSRAAGGGATTGGGVAGVDAVSTLLQRHCPAFFKEDDRLFYQASAQLRAAEGAAAGPEREALVSRALSVLIKVPLSANLEQLTSELAYLKAYSGLVEVVLAAAAAVDPTDAALRPELGPDCEAARQRRQEAYGHVLHVLRCLVRGDANPGAAAATAAGVKPEDAAAPLPAPEASAARSAVLRAALASSDPLFHTCLYDALIDMGASSMLLTSSPPRLEAYLVEHSGLAGAIAPAGAGVEPPPVGPLSEQQYTRAQLLARLYVSQRRFREAAAVYKCLAVRRGGGPGQPALPLSQRVDCLQSAVLQACSVGDSSLVAALEADARLMALQSICAERVAVQRARGSDQDHADEQQGAAQLSRVEAELSARPLDVTALYNDVAQPLRLWDVCLHLVDFAGGSDADAGQPGGSRSGLVRQLWDHTLIAAAEGDARVGAGGGDAGSTGIAAAAAVTQRLGQAFYPSQASFPLTHVVFRLAALCCGRWPGPVHAPAQLAQQEPAPASAGVPAAGEQVVAQALLASTGGAVTPVLRCCELLLARRAPDVAEQELAPVPLRLALLRILSHCCAAAVSDVSSALVAPGLAASAPGAGAAPAAGAAAGLAALPAVVAHREAGSLAEACDRYALEARRIGTSDALVLADSFAAVRRALQLKLVASGR